MPAPCAIRLPPMRRGTRSEQALGYGWQVRALTTQGELSADYRTGRSPRDPRFARQSDGRGRGGPDRRDICASCSALWRGDRRTGGGGVRGRWGPLAREGG